MSNTLSLFYCNTTAREGAVNWEVKGEFLEEYMNLVFVLLTVNLFAFIQF